MGFSTMMSDAVEQRCLKDHSKRQKKSALTLNSRQVIREMFPDVPEDTAVFSALNRMQASNPERIRDIPAVARARFGDRSAAVHEDEEGENDVEVDVEVVCSPTIICWS